MSDAEAGKSHISDEEVSKKKLKKDGEGIDDQKMDSLINSFLQWCEGLGERGAKIADGFQQFRKHIEYRKISIQSSAESQSRSIQELKEMDKMLTFAEKEIAEEKETVAKELEEAKKTRPNKRKYDSVGGTISPVADHNTRMEEWERFEGDLKTLKLRKEALQKNVEESQKLLSELVTTTDELQHKFRKDLEEWEEVVKLIF